MMDQLTGVFETRYAILMDSPDLITILSPERTIAVANNACAHYFRSPAADLTGMDMITFMGAHNAASYLDFSNTMSSDQPRITKVYEMGRFGCKRWINWTENGVYTPDGTLIEIIAVGRDVDELNRIKMLQSETANLLQAYSDAINSNFMCSIADIDGTITYVNDNFCQLTGYEQHELLGQNHSILNSGYHEKAFFAYMWATIKGGKAWRGEIRNKNKQGAFIWLNTAIIPITNSAQEVVSFLSLKTDITSEKLVAQERLDYLQSIEELLWMVSHELRRPLSNCAGIIAMLQQNTAIDTEAREMLQYLEISAKDMDAYSRKMNAYLTKSKRGREA